MGGDTWRRDFQEARGNGGGGGRDDSRQFKQRQQLSEANPRPKFDLCVEMLNGRYDQEMKLELELGTVVEGGDERRGRKRQSTTNRCPADNCCIDINYKPWLSRKL